MQNSEINFTAIFDHYTPINLEPFYVFTTEVRYLVKCEDYPELIGELSPSARVNLKGQVDKKYKEGIKLKNVEWRLL